MKLHDFGAFILVAAMIGFAMQAAFQSGQGNPGVDYIFQATQETQQ